MEGLRDLEDGHEALKEGIDVGFASFEELFDGEERVRNLAFRALE